MSRVAPALARRLDRVARKAHRFHRFAHHPLCDRYAGEVVRLGRRARICRGCALVAAGLGLGFVAGLALAVPTWIGLAAVAVALALMLPARSLPATAARQAGGSRALPPPELVARSRTRAHRPGARKFFSRLLPAAALAFAATRPVRDPDLSAVLVAALAAALFLAGWAAYRRRGPDRTPCLACPERERHVVCSGFAPMARRERAFGRLARRLLAQRV